MNTGSFVTKALAERTQAWPSGGCTAKKVRGQDQVTVPEEWKADSLNQSCFPKSIRSQFSPPGHWFTEPEILRKMCVCVYNLEFQLWTHIA